MLSIRHAVRLFLAVAAALLLAACGQKGGLYMATPAPSTEQQTLKVGTEEGADLSVSGGAALDSAEEAEGRQMSK